MAVAVRELILTLPNVSLKFVFSRARALLYMLVSAGFAAGLVALLRYLSEPSNRLAAVEQIVLAALGAGRAVGAPRARLSPGRGEGVSAAPGAAKAGAIVDALLRALAREISQEVKDKQARLVSAAAHVKYETALPMFVEHLGHLDDPTDGRTDQDRKDDLNRQRARIDDLALDDEDVARDALLYLVLERGGEPYFNTLMDFYDARTGRTRTKPAGWWLRAAARHKRWLALCAQHNQSVVAAGAKAPVQPPPAKPGGAPAGESGSPGTSSGSGPNEASGTTS